MVCKSGTHHRVLDLQMLIKSTVRTEGKIIKLQYRNINSKLEEHFFHSYKHGVHKPFECFFFFFFFREHWVFVLDHFSEFLQSIPRRAEPQEPPRCCHSSLPFPPLTCLTHNTNITAPAVVFINEVRSCSEAGFLNGLVF